MKVRRVIATQRTVVFSPHHKISGLFYEATIRTVAYVPGSFWDFPAPRSAAMSARLLRGSALRPFELQAGDGGNMPPADVKDQSTTLMPSQTLDAPEPEGAAYPRRTP